MFPVRTGRIQQDTNHKQVNARIIEGTRLNMVTLETERLIIRDNIPGDLHDLYELTTDEHAMRFMKSTKIETRKEAKKNLKISIRESKRKNRLLYGITREEWLAAD